MKSKLLGAIALATTTMLGAADANAASDAVNADVVTYHTVQVDGIKIFYREAGNPNKPTILLLHGFPSSSFMYRELLSRLSNDFHLIAPDYPGAGFSEYPSADKFKPTFENLANVMTTFVQTVGLHRFTLYMQDFGGPVGFRMAVKHPEWVDGLIIQNANAYVEGIAPEPLQGMKARVAGPLSGQQREEVAQIVSRDGALFLYKTGARNFDAMSPDGYNMDAWVLGNPDAYRMQTELIINYATNFSEYPRWQEYLRTKQPKTLIVWGKNDPLFLPPGAEAYRKDLPKAELHFFNTGHFALEEEAPAIAGYIKQTFAPK